MQSYNNAKVCMYARASVTSQVNNGVSIAEQIERGRQWCEQSGAVLIDTVAEAGASSAVRPRLREMIMRATGKDHPYDVILVSSLSRLFRNPMLLEKRRQTLGEANVAIVSVT